MALPTQEIERLSRAPSTEQGSYKQLLLLAGSLFAISLIIYLGLSYGYEPYLNGQKDDLDAQIQTFSQKISQEDQAKLVGFYSQLANIKTLLGKHPSTSRIFDWLGQNTQSNTYFTKFSFNVPTNQLTLLGNSKSPQDAAEQAAIFESRPEISRLNLNNLAAAPGGGWQFNMTVFMDPKFLLPATGAASGAAPTTPVVDVAPAATTTQSGFSTSTQSGNATTTP
ncbi:MAG: hypothetical protein LiPW15_460 [Parcubacteria group bacterium LiPW_15]|nr:MAG: hypothetical protein LiPW15_460 [Parcubacteria group bacterium LiPW_15]